MIVTDLDLPGLRLFTLERATDDRGFFTETWSERRLADAGIPHHFVQDNISWSEQGVLRGLHFQHPQGQGKLVTVVIGAVFDVVVDLRVGSPSFGHWRGLELSAENRRQLFIPPGFAHGFVTTAEYALFAYKCTDFYNPALEHSLAWNDPDIGIDWPIAEPRLSQRDRAAKPLSALLTGDLPRFDSDPDPASRN